MKKIKFISQKNNKYQMSTSTGFNHLIMKRIQTSFGKNKELPSKSNKIKQKNNQISFQPSNLNISVDFKTHMIREKQYFMKLRPNNTINFQSDAPKVKRKNNLFFNDPKKDFEGINPKGVKLAYGSTSPKAIRNRLSIYTSQKSIKQKKKRLSFSSENRGKNQPIENANPSSPSVQIHAKKNQTVNIQKHLIIAKYQKVTQLLKQQKYSQASIYLKQIIPYIQDKNKKKQLYFWLIASLMKSNHHNKLQMVQNYIVECLQEYPNFYDIYLYWAKIKLNQQQKQEAIQIYEKAISINNKNSQAYSELANIYFNQQSYAEALEVLKEGFSKSLSSVSIPIKIIENYKTFNISLEAELGLYLERIQTNCGKKSTEFLFVLGFLQKQKNNENEALIYFLESLKYNSNKTLATKSLQNIIKIHISKKDFYAACYDIKRSKHLNIDLKKIDKYEIFLQGVNFIMKKKNEEGIKLLNKIKQSISKNNMKRKVNTFFSSYNNDHKDQENNFDFDKEIISLTIKYLAYAYFKLGDHKQAIKCYKLLEKVDNQLDKASKYNMLLAEGIVMADSHQNFDSALTKFQQAKMQMRKVQPWIYKSVVTIQKQIHKHMVGSTIKQVTGVNAKQQLNSSVLEALNLMQEGYSVNSSSSNLLYHRTILHLYFSSLKSAMQDINLCIEKAEQNLPKYFYLRGICFACMKNLKKAINQFSISISLSKEFSISYLQRAKCYFLSGQTEQGFQDLKVYMDQCPDDYHVHKWIGDLLFQGTSYNDSIKAYNQMGDKITLDALCMKLKAELRVGTIKKVHETFSKIKSKQTFKEQFFGIDMAAYGLLSSLFVSQNAERQKVTQSIEKRIRDLNTYLQSDVEKGKIFNLVDCMCLVGLGSFYVQKYTQAYEAFILVLEFLRSTNDRKHQKSESNQSCQSNSEQQIQNQKLNIEIQQENLDLREQDIYYNIFICLLAQRDYRSLLKLVEQEELLTKITSKQQKRSIEKILQFVHENSHQLIKANDQQKNYQPEDQKNGRNSSKTKLKRQNTICNLEPRIQTPLNALMKKFQIPLTADKTSIVVKTSLIWSPYHGTNQNLNFTANAKKLIYQLHAGYIDNMPEGPWIRRNEFGVLFTDNILDEGNESSFITTYRNEQMPQNGSGEGYSLIDAEDQIGDQSSQNRLGSQYSDNIQKKKEAFLRQMKLDLKIENKLNRIIKKKQNSQ